MLRFCLLQYFGLKRHKESDYLVEVAQHDVFKSANMDASDPFQQTQVWERVLIVFWNQLTRCPLILSDERSRHARGGGRQAGHD